MKKIEAIIKPFKLEDVKAALAAVGVEGLTITEVRGVGRLNGQTEVYRGTEYTLDFIPKTKIEIVISDKILADVVTAITLSARTGKLGDGKIFVSPVAEVVRIRTGERDEAAVQTSQRGD